MAAGAVPALAAPAQIHDRQPDLVADQRLVVVAQRRSRRDDRRRRDHLFQLFDGQLDYDQDILISPVTS